MRYLTPLLLALLIAAPARAQQADAPAEVLLLGTVHLDNPGRDVVNPDVPDVLAPEKQAELAALREALADFRPTKIAVEVQKQHQAALDSLFWQFLNGALDSFATGDFTSRRSEQFQVGFKLARQMGHERVRAVDHALPMPIGEVIDYAREHDPAFMAYFRAFRDREREVDKLLQDGTLTDLYRYLNAEETVDRYFEPYARMAAVADDTTFIGPDVVADYYRRNLRIFANIEAIAEPGERIFVLFGAGHQPFLRPLIEASPQMELVDPLDYL